MEKAHAEGIKVNVWTVNKKNSILKLAEYGVDGLITDKPDFVRQVLLEAGSLNLLQIYQHTPSPEQLSFHF